MDKEIWVETVWSWKMLTQFRWQDFHFLNIKVIIEANNLPIYKTCSSNTLLRWNDWLLNFFMGFYFNIHEARQFHSISTITYPLLMRSRLFNQLQGLANLHKHCFGIRFCWNLQIKRWKKKQKCFLYRSVIPKISCFPKQEKQSLNCQRLQ